MVQSGSNPNAERYFHKAFSNRNTLFSFVSSYYGHDVFFAPT
jgi:hypothetical protein